MTNQGGVVNSTNIPAQNPALTPVQPPRSAELNVPNATTSNEISGNPPAPAVENVGTIAEELTQIAQGQAEISSDGVQGNNSVEPSNTTTPLPTEQLVPSPPASDFVDEASVPLVNPATQDEVVSGSPLEPTSVEQAPNAPIEQTQVVSSPEDLNTRHIIEPEANAPSATLDADEPTKLEASVVNNGPSNNINYVQNNETPTSAANAQGTTHREVVAAIGDGNTVNPAMTNIFNEIWPEDN